MDTGSTPGSPPGEPERRRPQSVYGVGSEPDARFSLANERTALAWVRTALALVAGGVGLTSLARVAELSRTLDIAGALLCLSGGGVAVLAVRGWRSRERALRTGQPLPAPVALAWMAGGVAVVALLLAGYAVLRP